MILINVESIVFLFVFYLVFFALIVCVQNLIEKNRELKLVIQESWSYIKDSGDFIKKLKDFDHIPQDANMVTADVIDPYPSIPHDTVLLDDQVNKKIYMDDLTKTTILF